MKKIIEYIKKYKGYIIFLLIILLSIISIIMQDLDRKNTININNKELKKVNSKIGVYITGEIKNPGVYYLSQNSRVSDLIDISGGLTEKADINRVNLAQRLSDCDKITVPTKQITNTFNENEYEKSTDEKINDNSGKININTASKSELMKLNGIGESTANKIIEYRKNNTFKTIEDIKNVSSIGDSKFENIKNYICVD